MLRCRLSSEMKFCNDRIMDHNSIIKHKSSIFKSFATIDFDLSFSDPTIDLGQCDKARSPKVFSEKSIKSLVGFIDSYTDIHGL